MNKALGARLTCQSAQYQFFQQASAELSPGSGWSHSNPPHLSLGHKQHMVLIKVGGDPTRDF